VQPVETQVSLAANERSKPCDYSVHTEQRPSGVEPDAINNAIGYAKFCSRSYLAVIRVYDAAGNVIAMHEHAGEFKEW
jgi:hypothetical protein